MQHRENDIDSCITIRLRNQSSRAPLPFLRDQVVQHLVLFGIHGVDDGFGGAKRNFMLTAAPSINDRDTSFYHRYKILFPIADITNSTAYIAVRFTSSITGLTSTTSMDAILPVSFSDSIARFASR